MKHEAPLPTEQHAYDGLAELPERVLHSRREGLYLVFSGLFLGTLAMLNILGITRFIDLSFHVGGTEIPVLLAVGVLPYPVTFLCTDFISELYGKRRANQVVFMGLGLNLWVMTIVWLGAALPEAQPGDPDQMFVRLKELAFGAVTASMLAYLMAQLVDVHVFHFWKRLTKGRHLWLRNNGSTLISQLVDTVAVILITHALAGLPVDDSEPVFPQLLVFMASGYTFKLVAALVDTGPFYLGSWWLRRYLRLAPADKTH